MRHGNHETNGMILVGIILPWALRLPSFRGGIPFRGRTKTFSNGLCLSAYGAVAPSSTVALAMGPRRMR